MHFSKPALVAASFLWATTFASPINSPAILRTRGLIGGSTTDNNTKSTAGSTTTDNAVGNDNTKNASESNAVEDAIGNLNLKDITGGLSARDVERLHHGHKSQEGEIVDDALDIADDATPGGFIDHVKKRGIVGDGAGGPIARDVLRRHHGHRNKGNGTSGGAVDTTKDATGGHDTSDAANSIVSDTTGGILGGIGKRDDVSDDSVDHAARGNAKDAVKDSTGGTGFLTGILRRLVLRDNDGAVHDANQAAHDANQAVHDANKAVHDANQIVHGTLHGLLSGILR
ncbi:uncharacterized protein EAF01_003169 [Botrytis porri]|uniref:Uncharacterized protein n=1 Tax=Botrytis porri TaxID=87229 RepID=A0A4Z1KKC2_9HELO|nr:uncharacterized protein EAF01_003169 [Botrytis porri]KAF7909451.1 hypothetical protein EAF01_003169 [Botrytis porri]TGO86527.1 hypothetical protein BPOR_0296g00100 [Botrytis porri]